MSSLLKYLPVAEIDVGPSEEFTPNTSVNSSLLPTIEPYDDFATNNLSNKAVNASMNSEDFKDSSADTDDDEDTSLFESMYTYLFNFDWLKELLLDEQHILEYSLEYGFLRLPPETRQRLKIDVTLVTLGKSECRCRAML